jgi:hypothetical protein
VRGSQFRVDCIENAASVLEYVIVPEAQNRKVLRSQESIATAVVFAFRMLRSVCFDDQSPLEADKVYDVRVDDELPFELERRHAPVAQHGPKAALGVGRVEPHLSRKQMK